MIKWRYKAAVLGLSAALLWSGSTEISRAEEAAEERSPEYAEAVIEEIMEDTFAELSDAQEANDVSAATILHKGSCGENASFTLDSEGKLKITGSGATKANWVDPKTNESFANEIVTVTVSSGITEIGANTFYNCRNLKEVKLPAGIVNIGNFAFYFCDQLEKINLPSGMQRIGTGAFMYCYVLDNVRIPSAVTDLGSSAFAGCRSLSGMVLPDGITRLEYATFSQTPNLTSLTLPRKLTYVGGSAFSGCGLEEIVLPSTVTEVGEGAFSHGENLKRIIFSDNIKVLPAAVLQQCSELEYVKLPANLEKIAGMSFTYCRKLTQIEFPEKLTEIGTGAFMTCPIEKLVLPAGLKTIEEKAFMGATAKEVIIPKGVTEIGANALLRGEEEGPYGCDPVVIADAVIWGYKGTAGETYAKEHEITFKQQNKRCTVSFQPNGGTLAITAMELEKDKKFGPLPVPERKNYRFVGWFTEKTAGTQMTDSSICPGESTLYAHWESTLLETPEITKLTNVKEGVKVQWNKVNGAEMYRVMYHTGDGVWATAGYTAANEYVCKKVESGKQYFFAVRCMNADKSAYTSNYDKTGVSTVYVAQPKISKLRNVQEGIEISWGAVEGAERYRVMVLSKDGTWITAGYTNGTTLTDKNVKAQNLYTYTVRCYSADGKTPVSGYDTVGTALERIYMPPVLQKVSNTASGVKVQWEAVEGIGMYKVYYRAADSTDWKSGGYSSTNSYTVRGLESGKDYFFTVRCMSADKQTTLSTYNKVGLGIRYIAAPQLQGVELNSFGMKVIWGEVPGAVNYRVMYRKASETSWSIAGTTKDTDYTIMGLLQNRETYVFTVRCVTEDGKTSVSSYDSTGLTKTFYVILAGAN